jgi:S-(hydroxymethyl)glutathione dehydrogenase/alcohol dehydrogenase
LGSFSEYTVAPTTSVVKVDESSPLDRAAVIGCCVPTGYGSMVNTAGVRPGDAVAIMGIGGIGANALQGAKGAGARYIVAIDPVEYKRKKALEFGATHTVANITEAQAPITDLTRGVMADACVITTDHAEGAYVAEALSLVGRRGKVVVTAIGHPTELTMSGSLFELMLYEKSIHGSMFGSSNPRHDIPRYLEMYALGELKLDELITREYTLDEVNQGYEDMLSGRNIRGVIRF